MPWIPVTQENVQSGGAFSLICDSVLGADQASFDTNAILGGNIPATYKHLRLEISLRSDRAATSDVPLGQFNADTTAANYFTQRLQGVTATASASLLNGTIAGIAVGDATANTSPANSFGQYVADIVNYNGGQIKTAIINGGAYYDTGPTIEMCSYYGVWNNTAAITRIKILPLVGTVWKTGSQFTLYGLG